MDMSGVDTEQDIAEQERRERHGREGRARLVTGGCQQGGVHRGNLQFDGVVTTGPGRSVREYVYGILYQTSRRLRTMVAATSEPTVQMTATANPTNGWRYIGSSG